MYYIETTINDKIFVIIADKKEAYNILNINYSVKKLNFSIFISKVLKSKFYLLLIENRLKEDFFTIILKTLKKKVYNILKLFTTRLLKLDNKVILTGFPGSSNILTSNIIKDILEREKNNKNYLTQKLYNRNTRVLKKILESNFAKSNSTITYPSININLSTFRKLDNGLHFNENNYRGISIVTLKLFSILSTDFYSVHDLFDQDNIETLNIGNAKLFFQIREPGSTLISAANKFAYKKQHEVLNNEEFFENLCIGLKRYYDLLYLNKSLFVVIKAETRNLKKDKFITDIAKLLNIQISSKDTKLIWDKYFNKSLKPNNFDDPKTYKVPYFLSKDHYKIILRTGLKDSAEKFGYNINVDDYKAKCLMNNSSQFKNEFYNVSDIVWHIQKTKKAKLINIKKIIEVKLKNNDLISIYNEDYNETKIMFKKLKKTKFFKKLEKIDEM